MNALWAVLVGIAAGIGALIGVVISDLFSEEARARLDRLPRWIIGLAAMCLPADIRASWTDEWLGELHVVVHDDEALPLTRLLRGTWYAMGLLLAARAIKREFRGRAPREWLLPTPQARVAVSLKLEKARALVAETGQAISLELGRRAQAVERWAGVLAQTHKEIDAADGALAGTRARMHPIQEELGGIHARVQSLNKDETAMLDLERSQVGMSTQKRSHERALARIEEELAQLQHQEPARHLRQLEAWERILRDPKKRKQELDNLLLREWTLRSAVERERQLKASLKRIHNSLEILARRRQEIKNELPLLQQEKAVRRSELSRLQERKRMLIAQLEPLEGQMRMLQGERSRLVTLARRQRRSQTRERRQVLRLQRAQAMLPCMDQNLESALQLAGLPGQHPAPDWVRQSTKLIRTAWWREGARRRALRQVDGSGLGSAFALDYTLYQALKLTSREAGRRTLAATLVVGWLGRWSRALGERLR